MLRTFSTFASVKTIKILLSLYFLLLACIPCVDAEVAHKTQTTEQHSGDEHHDLCPPFCTCNCCGTLVISQLNVVSYSFVKPHPIPQTQTPEYQSVFLSAFFGNIWQPPKISALA